MKYIMILLAACLPASAMADTGGMAQDGLLAQKMLTPQLRQRCVEDFAAHRAKGMPLAVDGDFRFNEFVTRRVYDVLYWKGTGRGVAFTVPVRIHDPKRGELAGNLACFYAVGEEGITFQHSQQLAWML